MQEAKKVKILNIVLGAAICIVVVIDVILMILLCSQPTDQKNFSQITPNSKQPKVRFEDLTKEEATAFLQAQEEGKTAVPQNYVGDEIKNAILQDGHMIISDLRWVYSHDSEEEMKQIIGQYGRRNVDNYRFEDYAYYTIARPNNITPETTSCDHGKSDDCDSHLSFKRQYLDYRCETHGSSSNDKAYMITRDPDVVHYILRVMSWFATNSLSGARGNIYSYDFEEKADEFVLTINYVGAGANMDFYSHSNGSSSSGDMQLAINLYHLRLAANKTNGEVQMVPTDTGVMDYIKSFPITEDELNSLPNYKRN